MANREWSGWQTVGLAVMATAAGLAAANWYAVAEYPEKHIPLWPAYLFAGVAVLGFLVAVIPLVPQRLSPVVVERDTNGRFYLPRLQIPRFSSMAKRDTAKLKTDTLALVADIYAYLQTQPSSLGSWMTRATEMQAATTDDERTAIWKKYNEADDQLRHQQQLELGQNFGGRIRYLAAEYVKRGLLPLGDADHMEWELTSAHWIQRTAQKLESLAHALN